MPHQRAAIERIASSPSRRTVVLLVLLAGLSGCGTTRVTDTSRTATEQLLISQAVDEAVSDIDFRVLDGKKVFFDPQFIDKSVDGGYVVSSLRQQLLAHGALLQEDRAKATVVVEARAGSVGTDRQDVLIGVPQMTLPAVYPGVPSMIPEIPFAKKTNQRGVAKIAVFAYNRLTGRPVWQSGTVLTDADSRDTWVLGAGPFRRGSLGEGLDLGVVHVDIPMLAGRDEENVTGPWITATQRAYWPEPPQARLGTPMILTTATLPAPAPTAAPPAPTGPALIVPAPPAPPAITAPGNISAPAFDR
jgi:hypothetical protein